MIIGRSFVKIITPLRTALFSPFSTEKQPIYQQKVWSPDPWLSLNKKSTLKDALHGAWMMSKQVLSFSYDGYQYICSKAIEAQADLNKEDIIMLIELGVKYQVRLQPFVTHIENELFLRIYHEFQPDLIDYDQQIQKDLEEQYSHLEGKSMDFYQLLNQGQNDQSEQFDYDELKEDFGSQQNKNESPKDWFIKSKATVEVDEIHVQKAPPRPKVFNLNDLFLIADLLREWNCSNLKLMQYLLEVLTVKLESRQSEAKTALPYLRLITYVSQNLFRQYQQGRQRYSSRSVKRIYKFQYLYYQEHLRQLIELEKNQLGMSPSFVEETIKQYSLFPLKKRQTRRRIGFHIKNIMEKLSMTDRQDLMDALIEINGKDLKMKKQYRQFFNLPEPEPIKQIPLKEELSQNVEDKHEQKEEVKSSEA